MSQAKNWCFTLNNPTEVDVSLLSRLPLVADFKYCVYQEEQGEQGTRHFQGYVQFSKKKRLSQVKRAISERIHVEVARGTAEENRNYCTKESTRVVGTEPVEIGTIEYQGKRNDIAEFTEAMKSEILSDEQIVDRFPAILAKYPRYVEKLRGIERRRAIRISSLVARVGWQTSLESVLSAEPHNRAVIWYCDEIGNAGKSYFARHYVGRRKYIITGGKHQDIYYGYNYEEVVFFDLARTREDSVPYEVIENFKNGYFLSTKYEVRAVTFNIPHVVVFANFEPDRTKLSHDRWDVHLIHSLL